MRTSPFVVRKPLLLIKGGLRAGTYDLAIENRYDSAIFRGRKTLVLAEFSASGGGRSAAVPPLSLYPPPFYPPSFLRPPHPPHPCASSLFRFVASADHRRWCSV